MFSKSRDIFMCLPTYNCLLSATTLMVAFGQIAARHLGGSSDDVFDGDGILLQTLRSCSTGAIKDAIPAGKMHF